ncbi:hypothetical protein FA13DRAFT_1645428 [Coprinellus micaceus]|uniref:Uncharacterized protein n=1 Tax=Coprinellus micaceus TaxID=71717 RepID=A0A4Y7SEN4_COPMI|nr:hypothetical protein FA13DRAFT_1645428 [Coprinellus micaceus]
MPTTRRQQAIQEGKLKEEKPQQTTRKNASSRSETSQKRKRAGSTTGSAPKSKKGEVTGKGEKPLSKRAKVTRDDIEQKPGHDKRPGTIERGHIYFFYRPRVEVEDVHSLDEVKNLHMLLIPRPPEFAADAEGDAGSVPKPDPTRTEEAEMRVLSPGADAVPAPVTRNTTKQYYRLVTIGKKKLPDPHGAGRKETFWGTVTSLGEDLHGLVEGLGPKTYETKTRGTRHEGPARLVARGGYAIVNTEARTPSQRETHLGYNVSHPTPSDIGDVQATFGIYSASSFVIQVKNPKAPNTSPAMGHTKEPEYPNWIMNDVFGAGSGGRGRESYGLRFASVETPEMLDHVGAQLLLIAARDGQQGLETSLGEGRGEALASAEDKQGHRAIMDVFKEIGLDSDVFTKDTLKGQWA